MQITLNQREIEQALISYVGSQGIVITGKVGVSLIAGRGPNGVTATIDITNDGEVAQTEKPIEIPLVPTKRMAKPKVEVQESQQMPEQDELPWKTEAKAVKETSATFGSPVEEDSRPLFGS